ncbi:hypothetical protein L211DRAFT_827589 [Terfezia boudieri ATCC MYA-4762]|uniref:F-box domain-containing protein n=1 Tax=Terfezia boudieri ATCC MYA-4762 TaxID=1051890 RepID=A0A3N4LJR3_9PEZI|nr:hypothetical protein L211DRAFT_827589 [Terfezia boudieri ATCC MYA-4762]
MSLTRRDLQFSINPPESLGIAFPLLEGIFRVLASANPFIPSANNDRHSFTSTYFDILPVELQVNIFRHCSYYDLLNLRRTSHAFKSLIDVNESSIVREMVELCEFHELSKLFPPPKQKVAPDRMRAFYSLKYIYFLSTSHTLCSELAYHLAERAINPTLETFLRRERKELTLFNRYYVYYFLYFTHLRLDSARATLALDYTSHLLLTEPTTLLTTYLNIQREIITTLPSSVLITIHHGMTFLVNTMRLSLSPEPPHNHNDVLVCSLLRSHMALNRIHEYFLADSGTTRNGGRNLRKAFMEKMQREKEVAELRSPISFGGQDYQPKVKETWFQVAKEEMERRRLAGHQPELYTFRGLPSVRLGCQLCRDG